MTEFQYDATGLLTKIVDRVKNETLTITRTASTVTLTGPYGQVTTLGLNAAGYATSITQQRSTSPLVNEVWTAAYDATKAGLLTAFQRPGLPSSSFSYDAVGRLLGDVGSDGYTQTVQRFETNGGWETRITSPNGGTSIYRTERVGDGGVATTMIDPSGIVTTQVKAPDGVVSTTLLQGGLITSRLPGINILPDGGPGTRFGIVAPDWVTDTTTIPAGGTQPALVKQVTRTITPDVPTLYAANTLVEDTLVKTTAGGADSGVGLWRTTTTFDGGGSVATTVNPVTTRRLQTTYDDRERVTKVEYLDAGLPTTTLAYEPIVLPDGGASTSGRVTQVQLTSPVAGEGTRTFTNDYVPTSHLPTAVTDPGGRKTTFFRDMVGRPTAVRLKHTLPDGSVTLADGSVIDLGFDLTGNPTSVKPPNQPPHLQGFNEAGALSLYTPPDAGADGATKYSYDPLRRLTKVDEPFETVARALLFGYDGAGRPASTFDVYAGTVVLTTYDASGRIASVNATGPTSASNVGLAFSYVGPLLTSAVMTPPTGTTTPTVEWQYDGWQRVVERRVKGTSATLYAMASGYADGDGLLTSVTAKDGSTARTTYTIGRDAYGVGLPTSTTNSTAAGGAQVVVNDAFAYSGFGELKRYTSTTTTPSAATWLIVEGATSGSAIVRDALGRVVTRKETAAVVGALPATTKWDYGYDGRGRLVSASKDGAAATTYSYDDNGNRLSAGAVTATYDTQDRLLTSSGTAYTYTLAGALKSRGLETFQYDLRGNLRKWINAAGTRTVDYLVDGYNRRVGRKVDGALDAQWVYDDQLRIAAQLDGNSKVRQVFGYGTKHVPELVYQVDANGANPHVYRVVSDLNGSVRLVVDISVSPAVACHRIDYDPWGVRTEAKNASCTQYGDVPFGFAGGLADPDTGLVRFGARDYEPATGRWVTKDPIRFDGGANLYVYAVGDPVNLVDLDGRHPLAIAVGIGEALAGGAAGVGVGKFIWDLFGGLGGPQPAPTGPSPAPAPGLAPPAPAAPPAPGLGAGAPEDDGPLFCPPSPLSSEPLEKSRTGKKASKRCNCLCNDPNRTHYDVKDWSACQRRCAQYGGTCI